MMASTRPRFSFLICCDSELLRSKLQSLLNHSSWEQVVFWGDEEPSPAFWEGLVQESLFGSNRAMVVRNAHEWSSPTWQNISQAMTRVSGSVWPLFCLEGPWEKGSPRIPAWVRKQGCFQLAEKSGWLWQQPPLQGSELDRYIATESKRLDLKWDAHALAEFKSMMRPDANHIKRELQKLSLGSSGSPITSEMLKRETASQESNAFLCLRKLLAGDLAAAWGELEAGSNMLFFLLSLLDRELKTLWQICRGESSLYYSGDMGQKKMLAKRLGPTGVSAALVALADAEWRVKSGSCTVDQAMEFLIATLGSLFQKES